MASKGWTVFAVMLGLCGCFLLTNMFGRADNVVVQVSPQGSAIIVQQTDGLFLNVWPHKSADVVETPVFSLPLSEARSADDIHDFVAPDMGSIGRDCDLYH